MALTRKMAEFPKILLVEDDSDDAELALLAIEFSGEPCEARVVRDGAEACETLLGLDDGQSLESSVPPRLAVLDLKMPKLSGTGVLRAMRSNPRTT